jgi:hypothetical protein
VSNWRSKRISFLDQARGVASLNGGCDQDQKNKWHAFSWDFSPMLLEKDGDLIELALGEGKAMTFS